MWREDGEPLSGLLGEWLQARAGLDLELLPQSEGLHGCIEQDGGGDARCRWLSVVTSVSPPSNWRPTGKSREDQSQGSEAFGDLCHTERTEKGSLLTSLPDVVPIVSFIVLFASSPVFLVSSSLVSMLV